MNTFTYENKDVLDWNLKCPPGTEVVLTDDFGMEHRTKTRSVAWTTAARDSLVLVEGKTGGYLLSRIRPAREAAKGK